MAPSQAWRGAKALATAERARAEEGAGLVELMVAERVVETAQEVLVTAVAVEAGVAREGCAGAALALAGHSVTNMEVGVVEEARAVEARAAVAVAVAVAGAEVKEAAA
jgi:hypothetical protein